MKSPPNNPTLISAADFMHRYVELSNLYGSHNTSEALKKELYLMLRALEKNFSAISDGYVARTKGIKLVPGAIDEWLHIPQTQLLQGAVDLTSTHEALPGEELSNADIEKYCNGKTQDKFTAKNNPFLIALARGDRQLVSEFVDARHARTGALSLASMLVGYDTPLYSAFGRAADNGIVRVINISLHPAPKEGALGYSLIMGGINGVLSQSRINTGCLDRKAIWTLSPEQRAAIGYGSTLEAMASAKA